MFTARLGPFRVGAEGIRIDADLIGNEREQRPRRLLVDAQESAWISRQTELHRKAESILFAATCLHQLQVFVAEQVVLGEFRLVRRQGLEDRALSRR